MWIEIFRTGKHTDSAGNEKTWTEKDLDTIVAKYDPAINEAPVVIGHPKENAPAFGWVESLKRDGEILLAKVKNLVPEFVGMVKNGLFKKRSISLYPDLSLRHVGFLGAVPPAVKGLADVQFRNAECGMTVETEFIEPYQEETIRSVFRRIREWIIEKFGLEEADKIITSWDVDSLEVRNAETGIRNSNFGMRDKETKTKGGTDMKEFLEKLKALITGVEKDLGAPTQFSEAEVKAREEAAAKKAKDAAALEFSEKEKTREAEIKAREDALKAKETEARNAEIVSFVERLKQQGKIIPAMEKIGAGITTFMTKLSTSPLVMEFKEGDVEKKQTPLEFMLSFLSAMPKLIEFGEVAKRDKETGDAAEKLAALIKKKMDANKDLSYSEGLKQTQIEYPEIAREVADALQSGREKK